MAHQHHHADRSAVIAALVDLTERGELEWTQYLNYGYQATWRDVNLDLWAGNPRRLDMKDSMGQRIERLQGKRSGVETLIGAVINQVTARLQRQQQWQQAEAEQARADAERSLDALSAFSLQLRAAQAA
jgi:N-glycosylase/DNA lyase